MNFENLLSRTHQPGYACWEFLCEAWQQLFNESLQQKMNDFMNGNDAAFKQLSKPKEACIVFFYRSEKSPTHVGLFIGGKVLHLGFRGAQYVPLDIVKMTFSEVRFYL